MDTKSDGKNVVRSALRGVSYLAGVQGFSRIVTAAVNVWIARQLPPALYGASAIQLHLLLTTALFFGREGFRRTALRSEASTPEHRQYVVNLAWMPVLVGMGTTLLVYWLFAFFGYGDENVENALAPGEYDAALWITCTAAWVELMAEPFYILASVEMLYGLRASVEAIAVLVRVIVTYWGVVMGQGLRAFGWGHLGYSLTLVVLYWKWGWSQSSRMFPSWRIGVGKRGWTLALSYTGQAVVKHVLAEGDKIVLASRGVLGGEDGGVFGLVSNLGSLAARVLFQPMEEAGFATFAKLVGGTKDEEQQRKKGITAAHLLTLQTKFVVLVGLLFAVFGPPFSRLLLHWLYGARWSGYKAPQALGVYCVYVLVMALNGTGEAFAHAGSSGKDMMRQNGVLIGISILHLAASMWTVTRWGAVGLIVSNAVALAGRAMWAAHVAQDIFARLELPTAFRVRHCIPSWVVLCAFAASGIAAHVSALWSGGGVERGMVVHLGVGVGGVALVAGAVWKYEQSAVMDMKRLWKGKVE